MPDRLPAPTPLGLRLRGLRQARRWSQQTLARHARLSQPTVSRLESGRRGKRLAGCVLHALAAALGVDPAELVGDENMPVA